MANNNPAHTVLSNVRLSYVNLLTPKAGQDGGTPKYSCTVLVPKVPTDNRAKIDACIQYATEVAHAKFGAGFPAQPKISVHDGDGVRPSDGQPFGEECRGCWVFTASSKQKPRIVDGNRDDILDATQIYSGMYANVGVTFYGYNAPQNKGISVALDNVQKVADGEPLGGSRASVEDDFTVITQPETMTPQTGYMPQAQTYPQYNPQPAMQPSQTYPQYNPQPAMQPSQAYPQYNPQPMMQQPQAYPQPAPQQTPYNAPVKPAVQPSFVVPQIDPITGLPNV